MDSVELLDWVPDTWRQARILPEALRGVGSPNLMVNMQGRVRCDPGVQWHLGGIGQFVHCVKGQCTLFTWSAGSIILLGCDLDNMGRFMYVDMMPNIFHTGHSPMSSMC